MKFAVLGAGNGGQAMAAYLALKGYRVNLYNRRFSRIEAVKREGGIYLTGVEKGFARLDLVTTDIGQAIEDTEIIMIVTPAVAHKYLASQLAPYLQDNQKIILNPGRTGGALEFYHILKQNGCQADILLAEAQTFIFASRVTGPAVAKIYGIKNYVAVAAFPSNQTRLVVDELLKVFPQFSPVENIMKTSLDNIGAIFHPAPTLLNMAWIESTGGSFNYYQQGISPAISKIMESIDNERMNIARKLGIDPLSAADWLRLCYGVRGNNLYELLQNNGQYQGIGAPDHINHRYVLEDVPMSLVPLASFGEMLNVKTPSINMIIDLANLVYDVDFRKTGRTVESLGIDELSVSQLTNLVNKGSADNIKKMPGLRKSFYDKVDNIYYGKFDKYRKEVE
ncbi:MAG: NAD/NADP octopine/nopaline dehydrogenase family protein [Halanaerobiaceae bacterium]